MTTIYHNPRCSKSRETLTLLEGKNIVPNVIKYLETPPNVEELDKILTLLNKEPLDIIRTGEALFKELGLSQTDKRSRQAWIDILVRHPQLIERPIVLHNGQAAIGRPPSSVLKIL